MSDMTITEIPGQADQPLEPAEKARSPLWHRIALGGVMLISLFLNFYQLGQNGFPNAYYAAGVRSMMDNLHNFFFVAYDPGAFVTIDKPPLGFWLQVISAKIFGFTAFGVLFPEALAGVLSVLLLYYLIRHHFGATAGLLAALALAVSPISVLTNRNNTIDSVLALTMLVEAWMVIRAVETGKLRWLLMCAVMIGLGFNIKMAESILVVPAFGLLYLLASPKKIRTRIWHLALALVLMVTISLAWIVTVDSIPASQRPYVGSTQDNSEFSLAVGYNGIERLLGQAFGRTTTTTGGNTSTNSGSTSTNSGSTSTTQPATGSSSTATTNGSGQPQGPSGAGFGGGQPPEFAGGERPSGGGGFGGGAGGGGGGSFGTGNAGVTRLFTETLGSQISWLLPMALLGLLALAWQGRPRFREDAHQKSMILWGVWLLTMVVFFSIAGFFHQYYLTVMAPALCALFGISVVVMWNDYRRTGWRGWLLPIALILTALEQISFIVSNPSFGAWLIPVIAIACTLAAIVLVVVRLFPRILARFSHQTITRSLQTAIAIGLISLMLTPAIWSVIPVIQNSSSQLPTVGPSSAGGFGGGGGGGGGANDTASTSQTALITYLEANQGSAKYLVAVPSSQSADSIILATNKAVMSLGGFGGSDPILTSSQLQALITNGTVRFFLLNGGGFGGGGQGSSTTTSWVTQHCSTVATSKWSSSTSTSTNTAGGAGQTGGTLYDCATVK